MDRYQIFCGPRRSARPEMLSVCTVRSHVDARQWLRDKKAEVDEEGGAITEWLGDDLLVIYDNAEWIDRDRRVARDGVTQYSFVEIDTSSLLMW